MGSRLLLPKTLSQNTDGVKFAALLLVQTSRMTVGVAGCSNLLQPVERQLAAIVESSPVGRQALVLCDGCDQQSPPDSERRVACREVRDVDGIYGCLVAQRIVHSGREGYCLVSSKWIKICTRKLHRSTERSPYADVAQR